MKMSDNVASTFERSLPSCSIEGPWDALFDAPARTVLSSVLPEYLARQRWFAGKARSIQQTHLLDVLTILDDAAAGQTNPSDRHSGGTPLWILLVRVEYTSGEPEYYLLPVAFADTPQAQSILNHRNHAGLLRALRDDATVEATLCDTTYEHDFWLSMLDVIAGKKTILGRYGKVQATQTKAFGELREQRIETATEPVVTVYGGEQSNTSALIGTRFILKIFRRVADGENPELELGRYLTESRQLACVPRTAGSLEYTSPLGPRYTVAILNEQISHQGDAWVYTLDELRQYMGRINSWRPSAPSAELIPRVPSPFWLVDRTPPTRIHELIGPYLHSAELLGQRTAELHSALAAGTCPEFRPEPFTQSYQQTLYQTMQSQAQGALQLLRQRASNLPDELQPMAGRLIDCESAVLRKFRTVADTPLPASRIRCHGDYHLGQVLFTGKDFVIIDFEGEPDRPLEERRLKTSPLRDVAGMIRSFHYAASSVAMDMRLNRSDGSTETAQTMDWLTVWYLWTSGTYLKAYLSRAEEGIFWPRRAAETSVLLDAYVLHKALYELTYELNNRPNWVRIPLEGILQLIV